MDHDIASVGGNAPPPAPVRRRALLAFVLDLALAIVVLLAISVLAGVIWGVVRGVQLGLSGEVDPALLGSAMGQPGALAQVLIAMCGTGGAAWAVYWLRRRATPAERAHSAAAARRGATWVAAVATGVAVFLFAGGVSWLGERWGIQPTPTNLPMLEEAMVSFPLFMVVFTVLLAPAYEELLFRRVLFGRLWAAGTPWVGLLLSSIAFAFVHEMPGTTQGGWETIQLWLIYGTMGGAFAWLYRHTGTLWAPIAAHAVNNALALGIMAMPGPA